MGSGIRTERRRCPNESEEYREVDRKTMGQPRLRDEHHSVQTSKQVVLREGKPVLKLTASCDCGWGETTIISGDENE